MVTSSVGLPDGVGDVVGRMLATESLASDETNKDQFPFVDTDGPYMNKWDPRRGSNRRGSW